MYSQHAAAGMAPQKPETFMLSTEAQQALPHDAQVALQQVDNLKYFLISAPVDWQPDQYIRRFLLPTGEYVSCVLWNNLFHISGTDIVRCLSFRFQAFGRPVKNSKKFEEGIFSDLRNLKSGTDASLEEPKSPFLDFLYKNNCIRTQKKQKVFYWYSVPHDRLFLDALERDLKREKMGQEATTVAVSEPALSFQYDSSQSLYEQLTKAQQANSSSFNAQQVTFSQSQSTSPIMRPMDNMPPPQMIPQSVAPMSDGMDAMVPYGAMGMPPQMPPQQMVKREPDYSRVQYNQNGVPITQGHQRHASMPAYGLEYSPAPSFVSSQYEDYSNRGISFEPITPPQQALGMAAEPAYIANEETGLYTAIPDHMGGNVNGLNGMIQLPPSNLAGPQFSRAYGSNNVYSVIEGSPTYKQRRRRSSIPPGMSAIAAATAQAQAQHRPSDLRRSVSASVGPVAEGDESADNSPPGLAYSSSAMSMVSQQHKEMLDLSRHGTPLSTVEGSPALNPMSLQQQDYHLQHDDMSGDGSMNGVPRPGMQGPNGVVRRARSATVMELGPYPQKSHSCPIPTCGRLFKRLEHLKRHVRTHTQERPYICPYCSKAFSRSDNLAQHKRTHDRGENGETTLNFSGEEEEEYSGEDQLGSLGEASPNSENAYVTASLNGVANGSTPPTSNGMAQSFNSLQTLSMPMTISQPAMNASAIM
ncbi:STE like transcription factor [Colletotrichum graminicola]|uniref:Transcription factor MST12 n=1 Tax=Colletotrichum graminicola (strain M1.001 / M2 / FGSC 10212) TaxID=645133 RepID=E3Q8E5_COLGM|nr:STE like transcription factor [Colletotrichum graminicola M1.001]EFQ27157.1 STE like transcription factor [Colletotrichum graminicola M1.001]WDK16233.1 STE like transcription factor [Colletotrichum graminicola]